ncbi:MAG: hypothetical protein WAV31_03105 [Candidatus Moraniibacteriota bacterium]
MTNPNKKILVCSFCGRVKNENKVWVHVSLSPEDEENADHAVCDNCKKASGFDKPSGFVDRIMALSRWF